jgi:hypothetical protein
MGEASEWEVSGSTTGGDKRERPPAGNHLAVLVGVFDMGRQWCDPMKPTDKGYWARRAYFVWELCDEKIAGTGKNHVIGIDLTLSRRDTAKVALWYKARTGQEIPMPYNPTAELGTYCMLNVVMNASGYPKVAGVSAVPKALAGKEPKPTYPVSAVSLSEFKAGKGYPEWVPWLYGSPLEEHVKACEELGGTPGGRPRGGSGGSAGGDQATPPEQTAGANAKDPLPW